MDEKILTKILEAGELKKSDELVEVGAGLGVLTKQLSAKVRKVTALEIDRKIFPTLQKNLADCKNVELHNLDIRHFYQSKKNFKLVANIPYYLTSPILRKFFIENYPPELTVLLVQKEVAEKICATKKLSVLALEVRIFGEPKIVAIVPPSSFLPPPKVESAILKISLKKNPLVPHADIVDFFKIVHAGFRAPRKKIWGSFAAGFAGKKEVAQKILELAKIDLNLRPEDLQIADWQKVLAASREVVSG
ncbi:16S rRNA (adenine(1518)-N(6)/adenine(1519)-N(6))-dimethyltransferase RsmA [Candidatus Gracilibacteria bacterium]|nr:16S rRNA (adenine(1518)-N(6)/adenine(1519)-N(6))-dimethyltransferase RsmA [Candidatus Gracilibacteria bacterium]MCF7856512.1 16S rRNA (adenine(1518)-N(6)/adenine(1519)-N(6))-dimethyltransferase RsmA [Candidatus Gracilibacteria bacterium]MCF7896592.1 16S rRNA (adenine(1518)-N(6)/adenine(1519)-N(6))-dimethyltransferase RsmA [Candidatus Gracilibacteria bacterium]